MRTVFRRLIGRAVGPRQWAEQTYKDTRPTSGLSISLSFLSLSLPSSLSLGSAQPLLTFQPSILLYPSPSLSFSQCSVFPRSYCSPFPFLLHRLHPLTLSVSLKLSLHPPRSGKLLACVFFCNRHISRLDSTCFYRALQEAEKSVTLSP
jgi:hypothetical protein